MTQERDEAIAKVYDIRSKILCRDTLVVIMISHSLRDVLVRFTNNYLYHFDKKKNKELSPCSYDN